MKKLLVLSICINVLLFSVIVILWKSHNKTLESIEVTWDYLEGLFPRKFNTKEKKRIDELRPTIENLLNRYRSTVRKEETELRHVPFIVSDIEILPEQTTIQISFFRDLVIEGYKISWERNIPLLYEGGGGVSVHINSDDFIPRRFTFDSQGNLIKPKRMTQLGGGINSELAPLRDTP